MKYQFLFFLLIASISSFCQSSDDPPPVVVENKTNQVENKVNQGENLMPEFPGGAEALFKFIEKNIKYPKYERQNNIQGRVLVGFVINEDGSLSNIKIEKGVSDGIDQEAMRVVKLIPNFKPGRRDGLPVKVNYILPIMFKLAPVEPAQKR